MNSPLFQVHRLNEHGLRDAEEIARAFDLLLKTIMDICPCGRELSIVQTKLEEASFFAKKAMASQPHNQQ